MPVCHSNLDPVASLRVYQTLEGQMWPLHVHLTTGPRKCTFLVSGDLPWKRNKSSCLASPCECYKISSFPRVCLKDFLYGGSYASSRDRQWSSLKQKHNLKLPRQLVETVSVSEELTYLAESKQVWVLQPGTRSETKLGVYWVMSLLIFCPPLLGMNLLLSFILTRNKATNNRKWVFCEIHYKLSLFS